MAKPPIPRWNHWQAACLPAVRRAGARTMRGASCWQDIERVRTTPREEEAFIDRGPSQVGVPQAERRRRASVQFPASRRTDARWQGCARQSGY